MGDHAVVYNHPCLVTAVDIRYEVSICRQADHLIRIETPALNATGETYEVSIRDIGTHYRKETAFVEAAVAQVLRRFHFESGLHIVTRGPERSFGLGSSSAITVATLAALDVLFQLGFSNRELFNTGYQAVLDVQGIGSGFDVAAAVFGGTLYYITGGTEIESLPVNSPPFIVGYSGSKVGTTNLVHGVAERRRRHPEIIDAVFSLIHELTALGKHHLLREEWSAFGELMDIHQGFLESLGVGAAQLSKLIFAARAAGAYGAKLSGAGGGDCMFAVSEAKDTDRITQALVDAGGEIVLFPLHADGVRIVPQTDDNPATL